MIIGICDNNNENIEELEKLIDTNLNQNGRYAVVIKFNDLISLWNYVEDFGANIDLLYINVIVNNEDSIHTAMQLRIDFPYLNVIFFSKQVEFFKEIFDVRPLYFLSTPFDPLRFEAAFKIALSEYDKNQSRFLSITNNKIIYNIDLEQLAYIQSDHRVVLFFEGKRRISIYTKLSDIEKLFPDYFLRCHQSYVINMKFIRYFLKNEIELYTGAIIPISQNRYKDCQIRYLSFLGLTEEDIVK